MLAKLNLGSSIAALFLFMLPWLDIQCSGKSLVTQTGVQVVYGSGSASDEMLALNGENKEMSSSDSEESMGFAPLVGLALIAVIGATAFSIIAVFSGGKKSSFYASVLPAVALLLLLLQIMIGFPVKDKMDESMKESMEPQKATQSQGPNEGFEDFGASIAQSMMMSIEVKKTPYFYLELLALAIPTLLLINAFIDKNKSAANSTL